MGTPSPAPHAARAYLGMRGHPPTPLAGCRPIACGKVRDLYEVDGSRLLFVVTDRISAFDVVMAEGVPGKGRLLNAISNHWMRRTADRVPNHLLSDSVDDLPDATDEERELLEGRISIVRRTRPTPVEWVVRGYLAGSGWKAYRVTGTLFGEPLPGGLEHCAKLPRPVLTPTTKDERKDLPLSLAEARERVGHQVFERARALALDLFDLATRELAPLGILLADTKFEFGLDDDRLILIDEVLTPDSSRFWPADEYRPGRDQPSYDKQILRSWLEEQDWARTPPPPPVDPQVLGRLSDRYRELCQRLTGSLPAGA